MFTRRGKYVVRRLPARTEVGSATTLLDAADVAMEDARKGPGKWVIEQPVIEVDVSKAYGVLAADGSTAPALLAPENPRHEDATTSGFLASCDALDGADYYQWYLNGVPYATSAAPAKQYSGLTPGSTVTWQVAGGNAAGVGPATVARAVTLAALSPPTWGSIPAQLLTVGTAYTLDLVAYATEPGGAALTVTLVGGALPAGLAIVGTRVQGTPSAVGTWAPVFRASYSGGSADSAAVAYEARNADVTAPATPTSFAAVGYSETQVRLTWVGPAIDTVVAGEWTSGLSHVGVYKDGAFVTQVATPGSEYIATVTPPPPGTPPPNWKIRSADLAGNRSAFTAEIAAGPLASVLSSPEAFLVTRTAGTTAMLTWERPAGGATPTAYRVYFSLTQNGTYIPVMDSLPTPSTAGVYSYAHSSGFTAAQEPWFYVTAVAGGQESAASPRRECSAGVATMYASMNDLLGTTAPPQLTAIYVASDVSATSVDAFGAPDYVSDITAGGGDKGMRLVTAPSFGGGQWSLQAQLTFHDYGSNSPPAAIANQRWYPAANRWYHKGDFPSSDKAHRNEGAMNDATGWRGWARQEERWAGFAIYLPGENDPYGLPPTRAMASIPGNWSFGPQLHSTNIAGQQGFSPPISFQHGSGGYRGFGTALGISHPAGAPVVRFHRVDEPLGAVSPGTLATNWANNHASARNNNQASTLLMEWDAVAGASSHRVEYAWRPEGPWTTATTNAADNITVDLVNRRACATGLSTASAALNMVDPTPAGSPGYDPANPITAADIESWNQNWTRYLRVVPIIGGQDGVPSLICPAPCWHLAWGHGDYCEDARPYYGTWLKYVLRLKISTTVETTNENGTINSDPNPDGLLQIWRNGQEVVWVPNAAIGRNSTQPHYWKIGIYHGHPGRLTTADIPRIPMHWAWRKTVLYAGIRAGVRVNGPTGRTDTDDSAYAAVEPTGA